MTETEDKGRITLTERRKLARQARQYGHHESGTDLWVFCPVCRERVHGYWDTATRNRRTKTAELDRMMVDHLTDECGVDDYC